MCGFTVPEATQPTRCVHDLTQRRKVHNTHDWLAHDLQSDQNTVERHTVHEGIGAVDGIENPTTIGGARFFALLFAKYRIIGKCCCNTCSQVIFGFAIRDRHEGIVSLPFSYKGASEMAQRDGACFVRYLDSKIQQLLEFPLVYGNC